jgi:Na+/H+ antiporter NhaD/arsenite permease-like protein
MQEIPFYTAIPFVIMLACIAVLPLVAEKFWEHNKNKLIISLILGIPPAIWMFANGFGQSVEHTMIFEYIPFIILLGGLFVITGGIFIDADLRATPKNNSLILATGAVLASFMGTTGAAMLLIRLILNTNKQRKFKIHTILFFIAIVANCGGLLTPLGDPPLFMMYLKGVDFFWFFKFLPPWIFVNGLLLIIYFFIDNFHWKKETDETKKIDDKEYKPLKIQGKQNFIWLLFVIFAVAFVNPNTLPFMKENIAFSFLRDIVIILAVLMSLIFTKKEIRKLNNFNWQPIIEVAVLFVGIFLTMTPVLNILQLNAESINISSPKAFYFITGGLSGILDNTPTAVTFYSLAEGLFANSSEINSTFIIGIPELIMEAICLGSVFFGCLTYIGNGPNFMVKSIAEQNGIKMPQFFQYMFKFSLIIVLPVLILCGFIFL